MTRRFVQVFVPGLVLAIMGFPLAVGFAVLAGVPPMMMVLTSVYSALFNAALSSSRYGNGGPNTLIALMTGAALSHYAPAESSMYLGYVFSLNIMIGVAQLIMAWLFTKFDPLDYVNRVVLDGLTVGAGIAFLFSAIAPALGFAPGSSEQWSGYNVYVLLSYALQEHSVSAAIWISGATVGTGLLFSRVQIWAKYSMLIGLGAGIAVAFALFNPATYESVGLLHAPLLATSIPDFRQVSWPILLELTQDALMISIVGALQTLVIAKNTLHKDDIYSPSAEMLSQGAQHLFMGFFQGAPGSSSFSKSTLMRDLHGGRGALVFSALVMLFLVYGLGHWLAAVPLSALAGCMVLAALGMLTPSKYRQHCAADKPTLAVFALTAISTIFLNIQTGLLLGVTLSLWRTLLAVSSPSIVMWNDNASNVLHIQVKGAISFVSSAYLVKAVRRSLPQGHGITQVVLDVSHAQLHEDGYHGLIEVCLAADGTSFLLSTSSAQEKLITNWKKTHSALSSAEVKVTLAA